MFSLTDILPPHLISQGFSLSWLGFLNVLYFKGREIHTFKDSRYTVETLITWCNSYYLEFVSPSLDSVIIPARSRKNPLIPL